MTHNRVRAAVILVSYVLVLVTCTSEDAARLNMDVDGWTQTNAEVITADIPGHGPGERNIFINPAGELVTINTIDNRVVWEYPSGTVFLKTVSTERGSMLVGMIKEPDNPQSRGGWLWLTRDPETGQERVFNNEYCVSCHADANELRRATDAVSVGIPNPDREFRDFVFYPFFNE